MNFHPQRSGAPGRPKDPEKRAAILDAAQRLFPERGYDGVSMDAIAQAAGVSKLTVYSHFEDKESLFGAAVTTCCEDLLPHGVFEPLAGQPVDAVLMAIGRAFIELVMDPRAIRLHQVMVGQAGQSSRLAEVFFDAGPRLALDEMEAFLRHANDDRSLDVPQPALAAAHFFCMLKGLRHMRVLVGLSDLPTAEEREAHLVNVVDLFLRAFAPRNGVSRS
jgi:TetR/AcrR family transcriptional regulator, mexJK operon transcriptional repressor